ncbi:small GTPase-binding protein [Flagelloscypha sp. PMI_526]|nr:small GTPase-binding protein [Flagelloscypha sp. PMI_526]
MQEIRRTVLIFGDAGVGKSCLLIKFAKDEFPAVPPPRPFENYVADIQVDKRDVELALWDISPRHDNYTQGRRPIGYPWCHVIVLAFSIASPDSLDNIREQWISRIRHYFPLIPVILVGCKKDLRDDERTLEELAKTNHQPVSFDEGLDVALKIGAGQFFECSAKTGEGVVEVFEVAARAALDRRARRKSKGSCVVC